MAAHCQLDDIRSACQLDCVRLTTDAVHGRILVATRDIDVGEVVLAEKPLLVWQSDGRGPSDVIDFLHAYDAASEETRLAVADFYCPDLDGQMGQVPRYRELSRQLAEAAPLKLRHPLTARDIHRLLMIKVTNAHSYTGAASAYGEIVGGLGPHVKSAALFEMGSKVSHACQPNTSYSSKHNNGMIRRGRRPCGGASSPCGRESRRRRRCSSSSSRSSPSSRASRRRSSHTPSCPRL